MSDINNKPRRSFFDAISSLFGWQRAPSNKKNSKGIQFVQVDVDSEKRIDQALLSQIPNLPKNLSEKVENLFNFWLKDNSDTLAEIQERLKRINQIDFARLNDPFISRVIELSASEATQIDMQDRIIEIECPDARMAYRMYELLRMWGITQNRCFNSIEELAAYGDCFWATSVNDKGVYRVKPIKQLQITEKLEFSPIEAHEKLQRKKGMTFAV